MEKAMILGDNRPLTTYICGYPGTGKSTLIQHMALQDIQHGWGVCVIDPHGDLVNEVIRWIPENRVTDTIWFDTENPVPIDFLSYDHDKEAEILIDQLADLFALEAAPVAKPRLQSILGAILAAHHNPKMPADDKCRFLDIKHFIEDKSRRATVSSRMHRTSRENSRKNFSRSRQSFFLSRNASSRSRHSNRSGPSLIAIHRCSTSPT